MQSKKEDRPLSLIEQNISLTAFQDRQQHSMNSVISELGNQMEMIDKVEEDSIFTDESMRGVDP